MGKWLIATVASVLSLTLVITAAVPMIIDAKNASDRLALQNAAEYWLTQGYSAYADPSGNLLPTAGDNVSDIGSAAASWRNLWVDGMAYINSANISGFLAPKAPGAPDYVVGVNTATDDVAGSTGYWVKSGATGQVVYTTTNSSAANLAVNWATAASPIPGLVIVTGNITTAATITVPSGVKLDLTHGGINAGTGYRVITPSGSGTVINGLIYTLPYPFVIAHRFGCDTAPENSLEALRIALETGVPALETDVQLLGDGTLGIMHDTTIDRMTTSTGNATAQSAASWEHLALKPTGNGDYTISLGGTGVDIWSGNYKVPLLTQVLSEVRDSKVLILDVKQSSSITRTIDAVEDYGLQRSAIIMSLSASAVADVVAAGITSAVLWDGAEAIADIGTAGVDFLAISTAQATLANINAAHAAGLRVIVYAIDRHYLYNALAAPVEGIASDAPQYLMGVVNSDYSYRKTSDLFSAGNWQFGMLSSVSGTQSRGYFTSGRWGYSSNVTNFLGDLMGFLCPVANSTNFTLSFTLTFDQLNSVTSRWGSVFLGSATDSPFTNDNSKNGYHILMRQSGILELFSVEGGTFTSRGSVATANITVPGTAVTLTVAVSPAGVTATRTDVAPPNSVTYANTDHRGAYIYFNRELSLGDRNLDVTFSNVAIN